VAHKDPHLSVPLCRRCLRSGKKQRVLRPGRHAVERRAARAWGAGLAIASPSARLRLHGPAVRDLEL